MARVKQKSLRMPDQLWTLLERESERTGLPVSELIRIAVLQYLERREGQNGG